MLLKSFIISLILLFGPATFAQDNTDIRSDVGMEPTQKKYVEVEQQLSEGLPLILEKIKETANMVEKDQFDEARTYLRQAIQEARSDEKIFTKDSHFKEISNYVDKMEDFLTEADKAMGNRQKSIALKNLSQAYKYTKSISESPILKLAAAEIDLGSASRMISGRDYKSAGMFLQRAIDSITEVQQDPRVNSTELATLKNDIIVTQQQVVLGKMQDEKRLQRFYPGLAAARVNTFNSYYSIWNRNDMPWEMY